MSLGDTMRALLEELAAPAATVIERDGPICGVCERDIDPANAVGGHDADGLVMRARALLREMVGALDRFWAHVALEPEDHWLKLSATDLEVGLRLRIPRPAGGG
jgi:hypothetical protein